MDELIQLLRTSTPHQTMFSMLVITVVVTVVLWILEKRLLKKEKTDEDSIFDMARSLGCSEYDIFIMTGRKWNVSEERIGDDFRKYLLYTEIPFYVRDYLRSLRKKDEGGTGDDASKD